jgi:hypothetical protein
VDAKQRSLNNLIAKTLSTFENWLLISRWTGKEADCINLFTHAFLFKEIRPGASIEDFAQVGIEVGVPQPKGVGTKPGVRKDLVVWSKPRMTTFDDNWKPVRVPSLIIEWKARRKTKRAAKLDPHDLNWINQMSVQNNHFLGYCVTVDFTETERRVFRALFFRGIRTDDFHRAL